MPLSLNTSRLANALKQFRHRSLQFAGVAALGLLTAGVVIGPGRPGGAVLVSFATSILAAIVVAAAALEREDFAQAVLDLGVQSIFRDRKSAFEDEYWLQLLKEASTFFKVLGVANHGYLNDAQAAEETKQAFRDALGKGKSIEILWLKPDENPAAEMREQEEGRSTRRDTVHSIRFFWNFREQLESSDQRDLLQLKEYVALPTCGITWADNQLVVTHYLSGRLNLRAPGFVLSGSLLRFDRFKAAIGSGDPGAPPLSRLYQRNYKEVASAATAITPDRVSQLDEFLNALPAAPSEADLREASDAE